MALSGVEGLCVGRGKWHSGGFVQEFPKANRMLFSSNRSDVLVPHCPWSRSDTKAIFPRQSGL